NDAKLPSSFPANRGKYNSLTEAQKIAVTKDFKDEVYKEQQYKAAPIQTYNISWGNSKRYNNGGAFGTVLSVIYRKSMNLFDVNRNLYQDDGVKVVDFYDKQNKYAVSTSAMANFSYVKGKHKVSFKNLFSQGYENNYYHRSGENTDRGGDVALTSSVPAQRTFYAGIFEGNHQLNWKDVKVYWNAGYAYNDKKQEDLRTSAYLKSTGTHDFEWDQDDTRRFWSRLKDHSFSGNIAVTMPYKAFGEKQSLKLGGASTIRFRDFGSRIFRYTEASDAFNQSYKTLPFDQIFDRDHISNTGFKMEEFTNNTDKYWAVSTLNAGYIVSDNKISDDWRLVLGARLEYFEQFLNSKDLSGKRITINTEKYSILPSMNLTYNVNSQNLVRFSASKTVSRPEFREIAPFAFFDYEAYYGVRGNPDLKMTDIYNLDLRYEMYPGAGEAITIGGFFKRFVNPIEFSLSTESQVTRRNYFFENAKDANTYGFEIELRKNLKFLGGGSDLLSDFSLFANFTYIFSEVSFNSESAGKVTSSNRPIQGQSPYLINGGLQYASRANGWNATLLYNRVGNRLALVGSDQIKMP
ncbi:MAG: TonB-dependent receptor, partial [Chitinophagaceae bacterium]|nr:TonB-dependent receptor [Chitinophagaceae bacterium]